MAGTEHKLFQPLATRCMHAGSCKPAPLQPAAVLPDTPRPGLKLAGVNAAQLTVAG